MKTLYLSIVAMLLIIILASCTKPEMGTNPITEPNTVSDKGTTLDNPNGSGILALPSISSISPVSAYRNAIITINGSNFGAQQGTSSLVVNGVNAQVLSWKRSQIKAYISNTTPSGIKKVYVNVNGAKSNEVSITVLQNSQVWAERNLDVTTYRNGDPIPEVTDPTEWNNLTTGAWCYYNNDPALGAIYGKLYNWYAVTDSRGLAPVGWHIPKLYYEAYNLALNWGDFKTAGGALKMEGTEYWSSPNAGATNISGFGALGSGYRNQYGEFSRLGNYSVFWCYDSNATYGYAWFLQYDTSEFYSNVVYKYQGYSVRCIKD